MARRTELEIERELLEAFEHGMRVTEHLVSVVPEELWHAQPLVKGRTIAGIVAHIYGLRRTFTKLTGATVAETLPAKTVTKAQALEALVGNRETLVNLFGEAIATGAGRIKGMPRRTVMMMAYLMQHDAHHRGQITRQLSEAGHKLEGDDTMVIWGWRKLPPDEGADAEQAV